MSQEQDMVDQVPGNWRRSDPLSAIYLPTRSTKNDRCNQQVVGIVTKAGSYLATWTMASEESKPDQRIAISRSTDKGRNWSAAQIIAGDSAKYPGAASYSWLFQVPKTGRIYCFYLKNDPIVITVRRDITGWLKWQYSDDDGVTWHRVNAKFDMGRGEWTSDDSDVPTSFIGIYAPHTTSWGDVLFSFARYGLKEKGDRKYGSWMTEVYFMRLDNILTESDPEKLTFTILPDTPRGLRIKRSNGMFWGNEPSWIELSDGRLLTAIRTRNDAVYYALSSDRGKTWTEPAPLRYRDGGDLVSNPNAPCPIVKLSDGRIVLMFYNAKQSNTFGPRNPVWISVATEELQSDQPIRLGRPVKFMEVSDNPPLGATYVQIASYSSFAEHDGRLLLFYNDCKHWVLFKHVPDSLLLDFKPTGDEKERSSNKPDVECESGRMVPGDATSLDDARQVSRVVPHRNRLERRSLLEGERHGGFDHGADLYQKPAAVDKMVCRLRDQSLDDLDPRLATDQRQARLVLANVGPQCFPLHAANVGRVAGDQIESSLIRQGGQQITTQQLDPIGDLVPLCIASGNFQRRRADVDGRHPAVEGIPRHTDGDCAGSGTNIGNANRRRIVPLLSAEVHHTHHQILCLRPGDQDLGSDLERQRVEFTKSDKVGDRFACRPPFDQVSEHGPNRLGHRFMKCRVQLDPLAPAGRRQQDLGIQSRCLRPLTFQIVGGPGQQASDSPGFGF
jgi:hypothetical protein